MKSTRRQPWTALKRAINAARASWSGTAKRMYDAAKFNRLTADWPFLPISANRELRQGLRNLRNRSRERSQNDDYMKRFLGMVVSNVAGPDGFTLLLSVATDGDAEPSEQQRLIDEQLLKHVKERFEVWGHMETASASGKLSFVDQQQLFIRTIARDGEVLIRMIVADNEFGFALKFIDVAWLDEYYNTVHENGNRILMSVEVDLNDRPVAYWLTMPSSEYLFSSRQQGTPFRQRVPASEFIHAFRILDDESQVRGVPWGHTAMARLRILSGYEEAELVAARVGACKMAWLLPPKDAEETAPDEQDLDEITGLPKKVEILDEMQPGTISEAPPGYTVQDSNPTHPGTNYPFFVKAVLRGIASGLEVSYASLAGDLEGANYSSLKAGHQEERSVWRCLQAFEAEHFNRIVFTRWLKMSMLTRAVSLTPADYARLRVSWRPRGWPSIEPLKEVQATILAINNFLDSHIDDAAERGEAWEDILKKIALAQKAIERAGLKILPVEPTPKAAKETNQEASGGEAPGSDGPPDDGTNRVLPMLEHHLKPRLALR